MGREIKRVALDFDWPLDKTWEGFINSNFIECKDPLCIRGYIIEYHRFDDFCRKLAMAGECSYKRPDDFIPPLETTEPHYDSTLLTQLLQRKTNITDREALERYAEIKRESEYPRWAWPDKDPVAILLQAADLPPDWATDVEREVIMRIAMMTPPTKRYDHYHALREENSHKVRIIPKKGMHEEIARGTTNYPHPHLGEIGIADPGPRFHELVRRLGVDDKALGMWQSGYDMHCKIYRALGMEPDETPPHDLDGEWYCDWGKCQRCKGEHVDPEHAEAYNAWEEKEPPAGEGWQVWETVSEGSPITPVFATADELIDHLVNTGAWKKRYSREAATNFVKGSGWAPSAMIVGGVMHENIESCKLMDPPQEE